MQKICNNLLFSGKLGHYSCRQLLSFFPAKSEFAVHKLGDEVFNMLAEEKIELY